MDLLATGRYVLYDDMLLDWEEAVHLRDVVPWTKGQLPVEFAPSINKAQQKLFFEYCAIWTQKTKVKCLKKRARHANYLRIVQDEEGRCAS